MTSTTPSVSFPVRWSSFITIETRELRFILARSVPAILGIYLSYRTTFGCMPLSEHDRSMSMLKFIEPNRVENGASSEPYYSVIFRLC